MPFREERVYHGVVKARQIRNTRARMVITPCRGCKDQIAKSLTQEFDLDIVVKNLWELVADALVPPSRAACRAVVPNKRSE